MEQLIDNWFAKKKKSKQVSLYLLGLVCLLRLFSHILCINQKKNMLKTRKISSTNYIQPITNNPFEHTSRLSITDRLPVLVDVEINSYKNTEKRPSYVWKRSQAKISSTTVGRQRQRKLTSYQILTTDDDTDKVG